MRDGGMDELIGGAALHPNHWATLQVRNLETFFFLLPSYLAVGRKRFLLPVMFTPATELQLNQRHQQ